MTESSLIVAVTPTSGRTDTLLTRAVERASITRAVVVERDALALLPTVVRELQPARACCVVADSNTMNAAGHRVASLLHSAGIPVAAPVVFAEGSRVKPRADAARALAEQLAISGALPVAVGSGVINDIVKYAAQAAHTPYVCVATAASMDGYAASGAAMLDGGFKRTLTCAPPVAIIADLDVIAMAPPRMCAWGYGDLAGKLVAGADWLLADAAQEEAIAPEPFALVQDHLREWLSEPTRVAAHDPDALRGLMHGLLISGFAMQAHGNSRPASGSDHQLSHLWEMEGVTVNGEPAAHGACVGIGAVAMLALYEWMLERDVGAAAARIDPFAVMDSQRVRAEVEASFAEPWLVASALTETLAKVPTAERRAARMHALARGWPVLVPRLRAQLLPAATLAQWLDECGGVSRPEALGIPLAKLAADYRRARLIRRRYTILDVLEDLGWLDTAITAVMSDDGFWKRLWSAHNA